MLDKEAIKDIVDINDVIEELGITHKRSGKNLTFLCPFHGDNKLGSCFTYYGKSFNCFACGKKGDSFTLIKKVLNCDFQGAMEFVANLYGGISKFEISTEDKKAFAKDKRKLQLMPTKEYLERLGLSVEPVYNIKNIVYENDTMPKLAKNEVAEYHVMTEEETVTYARKHKKPIKECPLYYNIIKEKIMDNPLRNLFLSDRNEFNKLIANKRKDKIDEAFYYIDKATKLPNKFLNDKKKEIKEKIENNIDVEKNTKILFAIEDVLMYQFYINDIGIERTKKGIIDYYTFNPNSHSKSNTSKR